MSIFEHVSVFISIILGLAVVHLLGGLSLILDLIAYCMTVYLMVGLLGWLQSLVRVGGVEA